MVGIRWDGWNGFKINGGKKTRSRKGNDTRFDFENDGNTT
jgi:hypothetical protein